MYNLLTERQCQVLGLWARGYNKPKIAELLCISTRTVEAHQQNILKNFGTKNIFELLIAAKVIDLDKLP